MGKTTKEWFEPNFGHKEAQKLKPVKTDLSFCGSCG